MAKSKSPKVSIVLPVYNGEKYIRQCIDSCLNQTYKNIELIIVNDASTDNTEKIVLSYNDPRITYIKHQTNKNLPNALNTGFNKALGEYLTWISDDNYFALNAIKEMVQFAMQNGHQFVYADFYSFRDDNPSQHKYAHMPYSHRQYSIGACFLYSKKVKHQIGDYNPSMFLAEDYDYWIRVAKKFDMHHLPKPLYFYRGHSGSLTAKKFYEIRKQTILVQLMHGLIGRWKALLIFIQLIIPNHLTNPDNMDFIRTIIKQTPNKSNH